MIITVMIEWYRMSLRCCQCLCQWVQEKFQLACLILSKSRCEEWSVQTRPEWTLMREIMLTSLVPRLEFLWNLKEFDRICELLYLEHCVSYFWPFHHQFYPPFILPSISQQCDCTWSFAAVLGIGTPAEAKLQIDAKAFLSSHKICRCP